MIALSFSQRLNATQFSQIEAICGEKVTVQICFPAKFIEGTPYPEQIRAFQERLKLTPEEIRGEKFIVCLPAQSIDSVIVMISLRDLLGYFPPVVRVRPSQFTIPMRSDVVDIVDPEKILAELKA
jgi:hypothetical protein